MVTYSASMSSVNGESAHLREFIDGLALGQLTPGPVLMIAAYVGYKLAGVAGAAIAAVAVSLPSFVLMLAVLPVLDRVRALAWT